MTAPVSPDLPLEELRIDGDRLVRRLEDLAAIGPIEGGGSCRLALTDEDRAGRDLVMAWMHDLGLSVTVDAIGNVVGTRPGRTNGPPTMTGSHIDTVATGGRYDGNLGVLAGLEVLETLERCGIETEHPVAVAFFTDEEGARFPPDMLGSLVYVGGLALEEALDVVGIDGAERREEQEEELHGALGKRWLLCVSRLEWLCSQNGVFTEVGSLSCRPAGSQSLVAGRRARCLLQTGKKRRAVKNVHLLAVNGLSLSRPRGGMRS